ncbi:MAG: M90 family metallopeptidase, partial [Chitinophagaceae bacterium]
MHRLLLKYVRFYAKLSPAEQEEFILRAKDFLSKVNITPVENLKITMLDRIYVAASAIIPIFGHKGWSYNNLDQVLIYPGNFSKDFELKGPETDVMGMVGTGTMNRSMIISIGALRSGFEQAGRGNTGIHEFVHLLDKADGATDGVPEYLLPKELTQPWLEYVHRAIANIRKGQSDINPYGATNEAEFLAVISEYFFQKPDKLKAEHPDLWKMLEQMY